MIDAPPACHHDSAICVSREFFMWRPGCHCLPLHYSVTCLIRSTRIPFTLVKTLYVWIADIVKKKTKKKKHCFTELWLSLSESLLLFSFFCKKDTERSTCLILWHHSLSCDQSWMVWPLGRLRHMWHSVPLTQVSSSPLCPRLLL